MKNLTARYSITQFTYWAASSGAAAFTTTYLLDKGVPSGTIGLLLAMAGLLSCFTQPILASLADKAERFVLTKILLFLSAVCCICFSSSSLCQELPPLLWSGPCSFPQTPDRHWYSATVSSPLRRTAPFSGYQMLKNPWYFLQPVLIHGQR